MISKTKRILMNSSRRKSLKRVKNQKDLSCIQLAWDALALIMNSIILFYFALNAVQDSIVFVSLPGNKASVKIAT